MAGGLFGGGDGSIATPFLIEDLADLHAVRDDLTASYKLSNDIDLENTNFKPIGWDDADPLNFFTFTGNFNGDGFKIFNGKIVVYDGENFVDSYGCGLFLNISGSEIVNLTLDDISIEGAPQYLGGIASFVSGNSVINNCTVNITVNMNATLIKTYYVGGLVGRADGIDVNNCNGSIEFNISQQFLQESSYAIRIGGLFGALHNNYIIDNCEVLVSGAFYSTRSAIGGFVGIIEANENPLAIIKNSKSNGDLNIYHLPDYGNCYAGGFFGLDWWYSFLENCQSYVNIISMSEANFCSFGGFSGSSCNTILTQCFSYGNIIFNELADFAYVGGFTGEGWGDSVHNQCSTSTNIDVKANGFGLGGWFGLEYSPHLNNCYSNNIINVNIQEAYSSFMGVIFGDAQESYTNLPCVINNSYFVTEINQTTDSVDFLEEVGLLSGLLDSNLILDINNTYYNKDIRDYGDQFNILGRTTDQLINGVSNDTIDSETIYTTWDDNIWKFFNGAYPFFEDQPITFNFDTKRPVLGGGEGTELSPYLIDKPSGLEVIEYNMEGFYKLTHNIDFNNYNIKPIGLNLNNPLNSDIFQGGLDGNGYSIFNILIEDNVSTYLSLFWKINNATIKNLTLANFNINTIENGSFLAKESFGSIIDEVKVKGELHSSATDNIIQLSGFFNVIENSEINKSTVSGQIISSLIANNIDLCSFAINSTNSLIVNSYSSLDFNITNEVNQVNIAGFIINNILDSQIINSYYNGLFDINALTINAGGLIYTTNNIIINNCYYNKETTGQTDLNGGPRTTVQIQQGTADSIINEEEMYSTWDDSIWNFNNVDSAPTLLNERFFIDYDFDTKREVDISFYGGDGSELNPFLIHNIEALESINYNTSAYYKFINDIDMTGYEYSFNSISNQISGIIDGDGYTILNYTHSERMFNTLGVFGVLKNLNFDFVEINNSEDFYSAGVLFRQIRGQIINCSLTNVLVTDCSFFGAFANQVSNDAAIIDCNLEITYNLDVNKNISIGSFVRVGSASGSALIQNCHVKNSGTINNLLRSGFGGFTNTISQNIDIVDCSVESNIIMNMSSSFTTEVGGFIARLNSGSIDSCYSILNIQLENNGYNRTYLGGFIGHQAGGTIQNCYSEVEIESLGTDFSPTGGFVGAVSNASPLIKNCFSKGNLFHQNLSGNNYAGGFVGTMWDGSMENIYSHVKTTGQATSFNYVGGFIGGNQGGSLNKCYAIGQVQATGGTLRRGGFAGHHFSGSVNNSYYDRETTGQSDTGTGKALPRYTYQMQEGTSDSSIGGATMYNTWGDIAWLYRTDTEYPGLSWEVFDYDLLFDTARSIQAMDENDFDTKRITSIVNENNYDSKRIIAILQNELYDTKRAIISVNDIIFDTMRELISTEYNNFDTKRQVKVDFIPLVAKEKYKPELFLYSRNKKKSIPLPEVYNVQWNLKLGKINELVFHYPYDTEVDNDPYDITAGKKISQNNIVKEIKEKYLIKLKYGLYEEWFEIQSNPDIADEDFSYRQVQCYSLSYELKSDDIIIDYDVTSYTLLNILKGKEEDSRLGILYNSLWQVGHIDDEIQSKYRSYDASNKNILECISELCEIFNCIPIYDTKNRIIDFYDKKNIGQNKGLVLNYGKYLSSLDKENDAVDICTRLKIYGANNLTIRQINPLGTDYIEDYSYFIHPFQMDEMENVIQSSNYDMSDNLCKSILKHQEKIKQKAGEFSNILLNKEVLNQLLIKKNIEKSNFENELIKLQDNLKIVRSGSGQSDLTIYYTNEIDKIKELIEKHNEQINNLNDQINLLDENINVIRLELSEKENYTSEEIAEKKLFTFVKDYTETSIATPEDLYKAGLEFFEEVKYPKTMININIVDIYDMVEEAENWEKIILGDIINLFYDKFDINLQARLTEINIDFDANDISLSISNFKDYEDEYDKLSKMIYRNHSLTKQIKSSKIRWDGIQNVEQTLIDILNNPFEQLRLDEAVDYTSLIDLDRIYDELERRDFDFETYDGSWIMPYINNLLQDIEIPQVPEVPEQGASAGYLKGFIAPFDPILTMGVDFDLWFKYDDGSKEEESE